MYALSPENDVPAAFFVNVPPEVRGKAAPPLYDGYRELLAALTHIPHRKRRVTDRIRNCAARMLCYLNYRLSQAERPEQGLQFSRSDFKALFRGDYSFDIIEAAQDLLIASKLVLPPTQPFSTDRSFSWHLNVPQLREAFAHLAARQPLDTTNASQQRNQRPVLVLVSTEPAANIPADADREQETASVRDDDPSHDQRTPHARGSHQLSMSGNRCIESEISEHAPGENPTCNKILQESRKKEQDSHPPTLKKEGKHNSIDLFQNEEAIPLHDQSPTMPPVSSPTFPSADAPDTPETILALFNVLRGWRLSGKLLAVARQAAEEIVSGKPAIGRLPFSRVQTELVALYLRDHDPAWQANYQRWCATTGIPDIWSVNKVIASKWPLALRYYTSTGQYIQLEDGTLLTAAQHQTWLEEQHRRWEEEEAPATWSQETNEEPPVLEPEQQNGQQHFGWLHPSEELDRVLSTLDQLLPPDYDLLLEPTHDQSKYRNILIVHQEHEENWIRLQSHEDVAHLIDWAQQQVWHRQQEVPSPFEGRRELENLSGRSGREESASTHAASHHALLPVSEEAAPPGWSTKVSARLHARRLERVFPPSVDISVHPIQDRFGIKIISPHLPEEQWVLTNQQVCALVKAQRERNQHTGQPLSPDRRSLPAEPAHHCRPNNHTQHHRSTRRMTAPSSSVEGSNV